MMQQFRNLLRGTAYHSISNNDLLKMLRANHKPMYNAEVVRNRPLNNNIPSCPYKVRGVLPNGRCSIHALASALGYNHAQRPLNLFKLLHNFPINTKVTNSVSTNNAARLATQNVEKTIKNVKELIFSGNFKAGSGAEPMYYLLKSSKASKELAGKYIFIVVAYIRSGKEMNEYIKDPFQYIQKEKIIKGQAFDYPEKGGTLYTPENKRGGWKGIDIEKSKNATKVAFNDAWQTGRVLTFYTGGTHWHILLPRSAPHVTHMSFDNLPMQEKRGVMQEIKAWISELPPNRQKQMMEQFQKHRSDNSLSTRTNYDRKPPATPK
jgi:hypothetical protein